MRCKVDVTDQRPAEQKDGGFVTREGQARPEAVQNAGWGPPGNCLGGCW